MPTLTFVRHALPLRRRLHTQRSCPKCTILVPGKFDALHLGHRHLVSEASLLSSPTLLSFSGMATSLKWPPRPPIVAPSERSAVLNMWKNQLACAISHKSVPFEEVRELSPKQFIDLIRNWGVTGVVCGHDWRFGRDASGGVEELTQLGNGLNVVVVDALKVDDKVVSSTRVREALKSGDVEDVAKCLGRLHRCVGEVMDVGKGCIICDGFVNALPMQGEYLGVVRVLGRSEPFTTGVHVGEDGVKAFCDNNIFCLECEVTIDFIERI